jgi:phospholipid/cholesterol/gamma-HCH transport system substrate-binding protein
VHLTKRIKIQVGIFAFIALVAVGIMLVAYIQVPAMFGIGRYTVTIELAEAGGLYKSGNVTYRGTEVGRVEAVRLVDGGVEADLSLKSGIEIPSDVEAEVHSVSAVGEQYVALVPRNADVRPLRGGDVIPRNRTSVPPDINALLNGANRGLEAIPRDDLKTAIDETYTAVHGLGPEIRRLVQGSTTLAIDAHDNLDALTTLVDHAAPVLDSQTETSDSVRQWAANLARITSEVKSEDDSVAGLIDHGGGAAEEARQLIERLRPTLPVILANLVTVDQVAITYQPAIEQLLTLVPLGVAQLGATRLPGSDIVGPARGATYMSIGTNLNLPGICGTGFLPPNQRRVPSLEDHPDRPAGDIYCRVPQDSANNVRGARNIPCLTVPGKRAPTVKMCESDQQYEPLNDGYNWKGDPNATTTGQGVPQLPSNTPPNPVEALPGIGVLPASAGSTLPVPNSSTLATAQYDPSTGTYIGPDGQVYTQTNLAQGSAEKTWQSMLVPPGDS